METDNHIKRDIAKGGTISSDNFIMLSIRQTSFTFVRLLLLLSASRTATTFAVPIPSPVHNLLPSTLATTDLNLNVMGEESVLTLAADVGLSPDDVINGQSSSSTMEEEEQFFSVLPWTGNHFRNWQKLSNRIEDDEENNKVDGLQEQMKKNNRPNEELSNYEEDIRNSELYSKEESEFGIWSEDSPLLLIPSDNANKWKRHLITGPTFDNCPSGQRWVRYECRDVLFVDNEGSD